MLGIPNPYAIAGGALLFALAVGGAYVGGRIDGQKIEIASEAKAERAAQKQRDQDQAEINASALKAQSHENDRQQAVREIDHEKQTIVERPVYSNVCLDDAGLRLLQKAADNANGISQPQSPSTPAATPVPNGN